MGGEFSIASFYSFSRVIEDVQIKDEIKSFCISNKILPSISPKKSWIGCIAGLVSSFIVYGAVTYLHFLEISIQQMCIFAIITGIFGQIGDFAESLLKRNAGVKDSGTLLLGHGGVLDRFDSLIFAAPLTLIYCNYFIEIG